MAKFYKKQSPHIKKLSLMAASQTAFAIIPILLLVIYLWHVGDDNYLMGFAFIALMVIILVLYMLVAQRYKILLSGYKGERELKRIINRMRFPYNAAVFTNLPIRYKKNLSELDMLIISEKGVLIIEVKNHSGVISGNDYDDYWLHTKHYRNGKHLEIQMDNPFRQIKRQREIIKSILRSKGYDVWVDNVLFFSNPSVNLQLKLHENNHVCEGAEELINFVNNYETKKSLSSKECDEITEIIKNHEA